MTFLFGARAVASFAFLALASALAAACASDGTDGTRRTLDPLDSCAANDPSCTPRTGPTGSPVRANDDAAPPKERDAASTPDAEAESIAADDCSPLALANAGVIQVRAGTPSIFTVPFGGATDTFKSGCIFASGPDRIQPLMPMSGTRMRVVIESTKSVAGPVVLYAKETCGGAKDLACLSQGPIELPIVPGTTYYVHFDSLSVQAADSRVTANVEVF